MKLSEMKIYWQPVRIKLECDFPMDGGDVYKFKASQKLAKILGLPYPRLHFWDEIELTDELKHKLLLLQGPYWCTLIKVMEARREDAGVDDDRVGI